MKETFEEIYEQHSNLVGHILKEFMGYPDFQNQRDDLIQVGYIALGNAWEKYDESTGYKFTTYAGTCIRNEMRLHYRKLSKGNGAIFKQISTDMPIRLVGEREILLADTMETDKTTEEIVGENYKKEALKNLLTILTPDEITVIKYQFGYTVDPLNQTQIAKILNCTQDIVSKKKMSALRKMKAFSKSETMDDFLLNMKGA